MASSEVLKNIIKRERKARKAAEAIIEEKALELYLSNVSLMELNESLEEKILQRTQQIEDSKEELRHAKDKAEAAAKAKSEFLSNMSHEIRTPLNAIIGLTELIIQDGKEEQSLQYASSIQYSAKNLLHIINEILDFSKIEAGKVTLEQIEFRPQRILEGIRDMFQFTAEEKNVEFLIELDQLIPETLIGDPGKLNQILINLVGNAFKFTEKGYVRVYFKEEKRISDISHISINVEDTGVGIPPSKLGSIFRSFEQADHNTNRLYGGTGLGLTITKKLIELQGGNIRVSSEVGKGSHFICRMPFEVGFAPHLDITKEPATKDYSKLSSLRVLVVEDVKVNRFLMKQVFKRKNIYVDFAVNGREALEILRRTNYDVVLMDLHMPIMDGKEATRVIRDPDSPILNHEIPIIALSADAFEETKKEVMDIGMDGFLSKPIDIDKLYDTLHLLLME